MTALAPLWCAGLAGAEPKPLPSEPALVPVPPAPTTRPEHHVDFEAARVEIGAQEWEFSLYGDVVVRAERFRLTSDAVTLSRSPRGVHVEGAGRLAFCPCEQPPVTLGFSSADLAPPTDVLLEDATLRVFGVPLFYSPYLWLRAPSEVGLLPPTIGYRGEEGVQLATGFHVPLEPGPSRPAVLDVWVHGYSRVGGGLLGELSAPGGRARVDWDYFEGSSLSVQSSFATTSRMGATLAGRLDSVRGERAFIAHRSTRVGALRYDRARIGAGAVESGVFGLSLTATAPRGSALSAVPVFGPLLELGRSFALGPRVLSSWTFETETLRAPTAAASRSVQGAEVASAVPAGPVLAEFWLRERATVHARSTDHALDLEGEVRSRVGLPLARRFEGWVHRVEPRLEGSLGARRTPESSSRGLGPETVFDGESVSLLAGLETALGKGRSAADLWVAGGAAGPTGSPVFVLAGKARADLDVARFSSELRAIPERGASEAFVRADLLTDSALQVAGYADGRVGGTLETARLVSDDFSRPAVPWLFESGWSAGGALTVRLGRAVTTEVLLDYDVSRDTFLGGSAAVGYRHVCDCLALSAWGGKRVGRDGFDLAMNVDLVP